MQRLIVELREFRFRGHPSFGGSESFAARTGAADPGTPRENYAGDDKGEGSAHHCFTLSHGWPRPGGQPEPSAGTAYSGSWRSKASDAATSPAAYASSSFEAIASDSVAAPAGSGAANSVAVAAISRS